MSVQHWLDQWGIQLPANNAETCRLQVADDPELVLEKVPGGWLMAMRLGGENSVITFGPVAILSMFVLFWALTAVYVRRANGEFDDLTRELIEDATQGGRK